MKRFLKEEGGFTLTEMLVTMMLMTVVMFALYAVFDMSIRVFSFGNDKVEATENARIGLARMEREIRAAYPENKPADNSTLLFDETGPDKIVFGNDVNGNRVVDSKERISYELDGTTLERNGQAAVEFVDRLGFEYLTELGNAAESYDDAEIVEITLVIDKDGRTQNLSTDVALRNRNT